MTSRQRRDRAESSPGEARPRTLPPAHRRAFVARHTRLRPVDGVPGIRLHLSDDIETLWPATEQALGIDGAPIPFWAFAWAGGLALARYLLEHREVVRGRRVMDMATGSGLVAIAAALGGATTVTAADIDPFAEVAVRLNARANGVRVHFTGQDLLDQAPPGDLDLLLCADAWYEGPLAERVTPWLAEAAAGGVRVLVADPGRLYLPGPDASGLAEIARYEIHTTTILETRDRLESRVFEVDPRAWGYDPSR